MRGRRRRRRRGRASCELRRSDATPVSITRRRFLQLAALSAATLAIPRASVRRAIAPVTLSELEDRVVFRNEAGEWHVWKRLVRSDGGRTVGPGYVGRLVARSGETLVDDRREPGTLSDPRYGGLGAFGWQHARAGHGEWDIHGRLDAASNGGFGIARSSVLAPPRIDEQGDGRLTVRVEFRDGWQDPVMAATYDYRVEPDAVSCVIEARQLWSPDAGGPAFVKEPKLAAAVAPVFSAVDVLSLDRSPLRTVDLGGLTEPWEQTAQLPERERARVRFSGRRSLEVTMLAWDGRSAHVWEDAPAGFDRWAQLAQGRPRLADDGAAYCLGGRGGLRRRWEIAKRTDDPAVSCLFHAWEGGTGLDDCHDASRAFGPAGEGFSVLARYSLPR